MASIDMQKAIEKTSIEIYRIKELIELTEDQKEKRRLKHRLKELRYLQLWRLGQLERTDDP